jgi:LPS-assembly lipoprotein
MSTISTMKSVLVFTTILIALFSSSCGFKLKGHYYLPDSLQTLYLTSSKKFSPLAKQVKIRLSQNKVTLLPKFNVNNAELKILPEQFQRRTLSLFPNGQVAEYELIYQVEFEVRLPNKPTQHFSFELTREFQDDPNNALGKERERQLILSELRVLASDRIMSQLNGIN